MNCSGLGELTFSEHTVRACDVHLANNKWKFMFILHSSKTHSQSLKPQSIKIVSNKPIANTNPVHHDFCPYQLLKNHVDYRGSYRSKEEHFFIFRDRRAVTPNQFNNMLKLMLEQAGINETNYSSHSMRAGRSLDLLKLEFSVETIKKVGQMEI